MLLFDDYVEQNIGVHPAAQLQAAFFVPTPPTDNDLLLFSSASNFSPADAVPLEPWLNELAALVLGNAVAAGEKLRRAVSRSARACDAHPPRSSSPPTSDDQVDGQRPVTPGTTAVLGDQAGTGRSGHAATRATGGASGKGSDLAEALRGAPRQPNQVVGRGLKSVDDLFSGMERWVEGVRAHEGLPAGGRRQAGLGAGEPALQGQHGDEEDTGDGAGGVSEVL